LAGRGQDRVDLPAMMGLVLKKWVTNSRSGERISRLAGPAEPGKVLGEPCVVDLGGPARDISIGLFAKDYCLVGFEE
jgi:hypothetical protein